MNRLQRAYERHDASRHAEAGQRALTEPERLAPHRSIGDILLNNRISSTLTADRADNTAVPRRVPIATLLPDGNPMGICRFFSVFHIRDDRLPLIVTDLPFAIHVNDADAGDRPFGIVHQLVISGERVGAA